MSLPLVKITLVKAAGPGGRERAWLTVGGVARRGPIHVTYDLPHLVVESLSGIAGAVGRTGRGSRAAAGPGGNGP
jgi:hypothetical protein